MINATCCYECRNTKAAVLLSGLCHFCQKKWLELFEKSIDRIPAEIQKERTLFTNNRLESRPRLRIEEK